MNKKQFASISLIHNLKYMYQHETIDKVVVENKIMTIDSIDIRSKWVFWTHDKTFLNPLHLGLAGKGFRLNEIIPIARPLSDLTKPITHNGETFVPIVELAKIDKGIWVNGGKLMFRLTPIKNILELPFLIIEWLIKHHFNLMDESEPFIPVTDEFNPYK